MGLGILAAEGAKTLDLVGKLRGYFIVVFAIGLFCGSIYLLLATNLGARMGFLVAFASFCGFLGMLGLIWFTNLTPLNALHGAAPSWVIKEVVDNPAQAKTPAVRNIETKGVPVASSAQGDLKATVDTAVVAADNPFKLYNSTADYVVVNAFELGGGALPFFRHRPLYGVMSIQQAKSVDTLPGAAPPVPTADPTKPVHYIVMERNLGAMRQPPLVMSAAFWILFFLSLYLMHNLERAQQRAKAAELQPAPVPV